MKLYFIRHGTTKYNKEERLQGYSDSPLTEEGLEQAERFAEFFSSIGIQEIHCSPFLRARKTAKIISNKTGKPIILVDDLKEICYGSWETISKNELRKLPIWEVRNKDTYNFIHPGEFQGVEGESYSQAYERIKNFLLRLLFKLKENKKECLIVSHLGTTRNVRKFFENVSDDDAVAFTPNNNQVYIVEINDEGKFMSSSIESI